MRKKGQENGIVLEVFFPKIDNQKVVCQTMIKILYVFFKKIRNTVILDFC